MSNFKKLMEQTEQIARRTMAKCRKTIETPAGQKTVYMPAGDMKYSSYWPRDAVIVAESGLMPLSDMLDQLYIYAAYGQNGENTLKLKNGLTVPPWAAADHISLDMMPVFYPGDDGAGDDQGDGTYGIYPPHDDQYYYIHLARLCFDSASDCAFLHEDIGGISLLERLEKAYVSYNIDGETGLCYSDFECHTVDWGWTDIVTKSGFLLTASLLRRLAAKDLSVLEKACGNEEKSRFYADEAEKLTVSVNDVFYDLSTGWYISATETGGRYDVWGTAFAIWTGACPENYLERTLAVMERDFKSGAAVKNGYVRHIPEYNDLDGSLWEKCTFPYHTYMNGGYWATPTGWYAYALWLKNPDSAEEMLTRYIEHTSKYEQQKSPFEWISADTENYSGGWYGTSSAAPYTAAARIVAEEI